MGEASRHKKDHGTYVRGRFREGPDGNDYALPNYHHRDLRGVLTPNRVNAKGKPIPRINHVKRALRAAKETA